MDDRQADRAQTEQELAEVRAALREREAAFIAFAENVAHDLNNPLTSLLLNMDMLKFTAERADREQLLATVAKGRSLAYKIGGILKELLLLGTLSQEEVETELLNMKPIVQNAQLRLSWMIADHDAEITVPDYWPVARGNAPWVEEVWVNYISNGIKVGGRPPRLILGAHKQDNGLIRYWVQDNGAGGALEAAAMIFDNFPDVAQVRARGLGLGLPFVKILVSRMGGEVGVEGGEGQGSNFFFTLPGPRGEQR